MVNLYSYQLIITQSLLLPFFRDAEYFFYYAYFVLSHILIVVCIEGLIM